MNVEANSQLGPRTEPLVNVVANPPAKSVWEGHPWEAERFCLSHSQRRLSFAHYIHHLSGKLEMSGNLTAYS